MLCVTNLFLTFDRMLLFKYFLNNKGHFYSRQIELNTFIIGRNVFLVVRKRLLCVRAKTDICERLGTYFSL